jgi:predicted nucleotidyltransferase
LSEIAAVDGLLGRLEASRADMKFLVDAPNEVQKIISSIVKILGGAGPTAVILTGSTARGELSFSGVGDQLTLRSDIELYVVCDSPRLMKESVAADIASVEFEYKDRWPEFHIDIAYLTRGQLRRLPLWIRHYEIRENGKTLVGEDVLREIPSVSLQNLDWRELNDVVLWRLLGIVARLPVDWLDNKRDLSPDELQAIARSVLDVTTWALPGIGILLPTFHKRVEYFGNAHDDRLAGVAHLPDGLLETCFAGRRKHDCDVPADALFESAIEAWTHAYDVATGTKKADHCGCGLGFSRFDIIRRVRASYRVRRFGHSLPLRVARNGANAVAAAWVYRLANVALRLRRHSRSGGPLPDVTLPDESSQKWDDSRRQLVAYTDAIAMQNDWSRFLPAKD